MNGPVDRLIAALTGTLFAFGVAAFTVIWIIGPAVSGAVGIIGVGR